MSTEELGDQIPISQRIKDFWESQVKSKRQLPQREIPTELKKVVMDVLNGKDMRQFIIEATNIPTHTTMRLTGIIRVDIQF